METMIHRKTIVPPNIPLFLSALLCATLAFLPAQAFCQPAKKTYTLSTTISIGMLYGQAVDLVYDQTVSTNYKISGLTWPFEPLFYYGAGLSLASKTGLFANLDVKQGIAGKTGTMTDSDYLNLDGIRTHYSESDSYTERAVLLDLKVGFNLPLQSAITFSVFGGFSYMDFKWSARDGYYQYPASGSYGSYAPWSPSVTKTPIYGTAILYEQTYLMGLIGLSASYRIDRSFTLGASCSVAPIADCYTADNHELRLVDFYSKLSGGFMIEPGLSLQYAIKPGAAITLSVSYRGLSNFKGDITQVNEGTTGTSSNNNYYAGPDSAGTGIGDSGVYLSTLDASLQFRLAI